MHYYYYYYYLIVKMGCFQKTVNLMVIFIQTEVLVHQPLSDVVQGIECLLR